MNFAKGEPIRVVVFGGGPVLEPDVEKFLVIIDKHPQIDVVAVICQSVDQSWRAIASDLWRRRGILALPLLLWRQMALIYQWPQRRHYRAGLAALKDRLFFVPDIHDDVVLQKVKSIKPDLGLVYGAPILKPKLFQLPDSGTLGIHHGSVPQYRGKKTTFWALFNGEPVAGVTIQKINRGLDSGDIVQAGIIETHGKSYQAVWQALVDLGIELYIEAILGIRAGTAQFIPQHGPQGPLYYDPSIRDIARFYLKRTFS